MTRVKICGLTAAEDVRLAVELGAWALGFVLTRSPRQVSAEHAAELVAAARASSGGEAHAGGEAIPAPHTVLVVTTETPAWIASALATADADAVQLSAGADGPAVTDVRAAATRLRRRPLVVAAADAPDAGSADLVLLDTRAGGAYGGTGKTLDWQALAGDPSTPRDRLILAGGLRPGNVGEAVRLLRPTAVDVAGGVEAAPGRKDHGLLRDFVAAVEQADERTGTSTGGPRPAPIATRRTSG